MLQAFGRLLTSVDEFADAHYHAFFSSELGGITIEPGLMVVPIVRFDLRNEKLISH